MHGADQLGDHKIEIGKALTVRVGAHVDRHLVERDVDIGAVIEVEAAQEILVGFTPLCWVAINPGTSSSTSPTRGRGCSPICLPVIIPCDAISGAKNAPSAPADTLTSGNVTELSGSKANPPPVALCARAAPARQRGAIRGRHIDGMTFI